MRVYVQDKLGMQSCRIRSCFTAAAKTFGRRSVHAAFPFSHSLTIRQICRPRTVTLEKWEHVLGKCATNAGINSKRCTGEVNRWDKKEQAAGRQTENKKLMHRGNREFDFAAWKINNYFFNICIKGNICNPLNVLQSFLCKICFDFEVFQQCVLLLLIV